MVPPSRRGIPSRPRAIALVALVLGFVVAGCSGLVDAQPSPTPMDFPGIATVMSLHGISVSNYASGDAGCTDPSLAPTAIVFDASGLDQATPVRLRIYIFRDRATFERRQPDVDTCADAWATDPQNFEILDQSPYVLAGQGPFPEKFRAALRAALTAAAGNGG